MTTHVKDGDKQAFHYGHANIRECHPGPGRNGLGRVCNESVQICTIIDLSFAMKLPTEFPLGTFDPSYIMMSCIQVLCSEEYI